MKKQLMIAALAATTALTSNAAHDVKDWYVGVFGASSSVRDVKIHQKEIGNTNFGGDVAGDSATFGFKGKSTMGFGARLGHRLHKNFFLELDYTNWGTRRATYLDGVYKEAMLGSAVHAKLNMQSAALSGVFTLQMDECPMRLFAKLGLGLTWAKVDFKQSGDFALLNTVGQFKVKANAQPAAVFGVGFEYYMTDSLHLDVSYNRLETLSNKKVEWLKGNMLSVGLHYCF